MEKNNEEKDGNGNGRKHYPVSSITHPDNYSAPYINTDKKPSKEKQMPFLYAQNARQMRANDNYALDDAGKWMMFYDKKSGELDNRWAQAKQLYNDGKLTGISSMKVSTGFENPRAYDHSKGVIIFYCGPYTDEKKMMNIGKNLLAHIPYRYPMSYKSDKQTHQGTRATENTVSLGIFRPCFSAPKKPSEYGFGVKKNHLYKIDPSTVAASAAVQSAAGGGSSSSSSA